MIPSELHLIEACDKAIQKCQWCQEFGHVWQECQEYEDFVRRIRVRMSLWTVVILMGLGVVAGIALKMLLEGF
jgi:hypothetical protein